MNLKRGSSGKYNLIIFLGLIIILSAFTSAGFFSNFYKRMTGATTSNFGMNITMTDITVPQIITVFNDSILSGITLNAGSIVNISINFTATDDDGAANLDDATAGVNISLDGETARYNYTCKNTEEAGLYANYSCWVTLWWWDKDGNWIIGANISDLGVNNATNTSTTITVNTLTGFAMGPSNLTWPSISPGSTNITATTPLQLNNTGNQDIVTGNIQINSTDLLGEVINTKKLASGNFTVSNTTSAEKAECHLGTYTTGLGGTQMNVTSGASYTAIKGANLTRGNYSGIADARRTLYICLTLAGTELSSQPYSTSQTGPWTVQVT